MYCFILQCNKNIYHNSFVSHFFYFSKLMGFRCLPCQWPLHFHPFPEEMKPNLFEIIFWGGFSTVLMPAEVFWPLTSLYCVEVDFVLLFVNRCFLPDHLFHFLKSHIYILIIFPSVLYSLVLAERCGWPFAFEHASLLRTIIL